MPIPYLRDRDRFLRLGKIKLGVKVPVMDKQTGQPKMRKGKVVERPMATDHFVVPPEIAEAIGEDEPKTLNIRFLFEKDRDSIPHYLKYYRGDGQLRCMGDGEYVYFRRFFERGDTEEQTVDEIVIRKTVLSWGELADRQDEIWETWSREYGVGAPEEWNKGAVPCLGEQCPQFGATGCRATGRLLFKIEEIDRLGFWELVVHQHALVGILSQLKLVRAFTRLKFGWATILHVPFKLHLRGPEKMKINGRLLDVWTPELEADPQWVSDVQNERIDLPQPPPRTSIEDIWGEDRREIMRRLVAPTESATPEDTEALDYIPTPSEELRDEEEAGPPAAEEAFFPQEKEKKAVAKAAVKKTAKSSLQPKDAFWGYFYRERDEKIPREKADAALEKVEGDFEKALILLKEEFGE